MPLDTEILRQTTDYAGVTVGAFSSDPKFLTLPQIAGWQIDTTPACVGEIVADLPALQRGAVWNVRQIEELWDSILRGFPIGAFTISPPDAALGRQDFKHQTPAFSQRTATHLLLDGQQRATAIALAFDSIWMRPDYTAKGALWIDISEPPKDHERRYIFRALTRAHPWGYSRNNPGDRIGSASIRAALRCFQLVVGKAAKSRPSDFALQDVWPWEAVAPVPVALLIQAVSDCPGDTEAALRRVEMWMQSLPLVAGQYEGREDPDHTSSMAMKKLGEQRLALKNLFQSDSLGHGRLMHVIRQFDKLLSQHPYRVPALVLNLEDANAVVRSNGDEGTQTAKDDIELLFVRLNASGTALSGEELIYSLIKARWPDVAEWMQRLERRPALPSRVAAFCVRLVLARQNMANADQIVDKASMPRMPSMVEFRRHMRDETYCASLKDFLDNRAKQLFSDAWTFLAMPAGVPAGTDFRLLPTQVVELAQRSPDVFLLLLRWLDRLHDAHIVIADIDKKVHRRTLGFLTSIAWFAPDKEKACAAVWRGLEEGNDHLKLIDRFNKTRFKDACRLSNQSKLQMIPLPTPELLEKVCKRFIHGGNTPQTKNLSTVHFPIGKFWTDNNWWYEQFVPLLAEQVSTEWQERLRPRGQDEPDDIGTFTNEAAQRFLDSLHGGKDTVLVYAQRAYLHAWYPDFDPSLPEMMEDNNRPWDWDHILPESLIRGKHKIPQSARDWISSIGNLRAWPLEANRSDGNTPPITKLGRVPSEDNFYDFKDSRELRKASFICDETDWPYWAQSVPIDDEGNISETSYLSNKHVGDEEWQVDYGSYRISLMRSIILRFLAIYENWYSEMRIADLHR